MPVEYMALTRRRYEKLGYPPYRWTVAETAPPFARLAKPLAETRLALIASAGAYVVGQVAYHYKDDDTIRRIPKTTDASRVRFSHVTEHLLADARRDPECLLPLAALKKLEAEKTIGALCDPILSCMGGIYSQRRVRETLAPRLVGEIKAQGVEAVLLVPLCPVCHQSMVLVARHLEGEGIPAVVLGSAHDILAAGQPPRAVFLDYPLGHSAGRPYARDEQYRVVRAAVTALERFAKPGTIETLPYRWAGDDSWQRAILEEEPKDKRAPRDETPRYQTDEDRRLAETAPLPA